MLKLPKKNLRMQKRKKEVKVKKKTPKKLMRTRKKMKVWERSKQPRRKIEPAPFSLIISGQPSRNQVNPITNQAAEFQTLYELRSQYM